MRGAGKAIGALGVLCCAAGAAVLLFLANPGLFGLSVLEVMTPSMSPGIPVGSAVYIRESDYEAGDVVAYRDQAGREVLHRIVGGNPDSGFILKGDANEFADKLAVMPGSISGKAVLAVRSGRALFESMTALGSVLACMGVSAALAGFSLCGRRRKKGDEP